MLLHVSDLETESEVTSELLHVYLRMHLGGEHGGRIGVNCMISFHSVHCAIGSRMNGMIFCSYQKRILIGCALLHVFLIKSFCL